MEELYEGCKVFYLKKLCRTNVEDLVYMENIYNILFSQEAYRRFPREPLKVFIFTEDIDIFLPTEVGLKVKGKRGTINCPLCSENIMLLTKKVLK